ncbi:MAG TPA: M48 family metallopeptidase [Gemmatimonadales bacterium]|nr:M48 family metallopeptidase [Gemmatimonadales bacterium]
MTDDTGLNLFQQQEANRRRTVWLVIAFVLFFAWLGFGGDFAYWLATSDAPPDTYHHTVPWFGLIMTAIGAGIAWYGFSTGPNKVLWSTGAVRLEDPKTDKERQLVNVVEEMAIAAGISRPDIWIVPDPDPNAFATGLDQSRSHIAVTQGLLDICSRDELQAVVAHELGHVKNLDVRLMTTLAALVGAVALMHDGVGRLLASGGRIGGGGGSRGGGKGKGGGVVIIVVLVLWVISWILAPIIAQFLAMAVSRKREYLADAMGAQFTRNPMALASALTKIEAADAPTASIKRGAAHLCIADPLGRRANLREGGMSDLFATHPPMAARIARLKGMAYQRLKAEGQFPAA